MKKTIITLCIIFLVGVATVSAQCCSGSTASKSSSTKTCCSDSQKTSKVKVYYFHSTRRCATCQAVESVTIEALKEYYGDKVVFESVNRDEGANTSLVAKYKISGTALLVVNGDKKIDITNDAFINARNNPDKLKSKLRLTINSMM